MKISAKSPRSAPAGILHAAGRWWKDAASQHGRAAAARRLLAAMREFVRDSTPARRRQRYGDADYDWEHRVDTTSAAVGWRDRFMGVFHSPYQPTEPALFHEMLATVLHNIATCDTAIRKDAQQQAGAGFSDFVFIDLGSGKGRTLLMASDYPFRRIVGVELLPALHQIAHENLSKYRSESQKCFALKSICGDATDFLFPTEPLVLYLFNPFPEAGLRKVIANLQQSLREHPRALYVLYHHPLLEHVLGGSAALKKIAGTHQYSLWAGGSALIAGR